MFKPELYIEGERVTLFKKENISVISSVQNIEDISRVFNDFSQSFSVPASKRNNRLFKHFYNASINNGFDARIRHQAHIDINGIPFKRGTFRLEKCVTNNGKPTSYRGTFFGNLIDLKEVIGDDYLSSLDLSAYDIAYNAANVITGITTGFNSQDYVFPLISTQRQWFYNSDIGSVTYEERLANIAWNGSGVTHGAEWTSFRPALKIMRIVEAIESKYSIQLSRTFLDTAPFDNLYLWLANQTTEDALKTNTRVTDYDTVNVWQPSIGSFDNSTGAYNPTQTGAPKIRNVIFIADSSDGVLFSIQLMNGDQVLAEQTGTGNLKIDQDFPNGFQPGASIYCRIVTTAAKSIDIVRFEIDELSDDEVLNCVKNPFSITGTTATVIDFIPKIKVIDFLVSLFKMYNLTVEPQNAQVFDVETLDVWYDNGKIYDISPYVDKTEVPVNRSTIYREIGFNFVEPGTILADQFNKTNNTAYGDLETKLKTADGTTLDGEEYLIEVDFEQMVYERLLDLNDDSTTNIVYGLSLDRSLSDTVPEAHILYIQQKDITPNPISVADETASKNQVTGNVFMPSHVNSDSAEYSTVFGSEVNEHTGALIQNSLYQLYYRDYITDSFSIKRRKYDYTAKLPLWLLNKLRLNDRLVIGVDRYIINQMTVNVTTQVVKFELLNDIFGLEDGSTVEEPETPPNPTPDPPPPPPPPNSFATSFNGAASQVLGCGLVPNFTRYWDGTEANPTLNDIVYEDVNRTIRFDGGWLYYAIAGDLSIQITDRGTVSDVYDCQAGGAQ